MNAPISLASLLICQPPEVRRAAFAARPAAAPARNATEFHTGMHAPHREQFLAKRQLLALPDADATLACLEGELWLTREGDSEDHILGPGGSFAVRRGDRSVARSWGLHALGVILIALWLLLVSPLPVWAYLLASYLAYSLLKIRTFLEHRAHEAARARTVIIEDRGPLALLFLNNNLHVVHHMHPTVPWYRLPATYRANREHYLRRNEGYLYRSYAEIFTRYFLRAKDPVPHPLWTAEPAVNAQHRAPARVPAE